MSHAPPTVGNLFSPKDPYTNANPPPAPYQNPGSHIVVFNTANKTSGTRGDFQIPIQLSNLLDGKNIHYVKIVNCSGFVVAATPAYNSVYVSIPTLAQPYTFNSMSGLENTLVGILMPYIQTAAGATTFMSNQNDNVPIYIGDSSGLLKNGYFNIKLINPLDGSTVVPSVDYILTLEFS